MGQVAGKLSTTFQTTLLSKQALQAGRRPGGSHRTVPALPRPAALTNTPHCGLVTLMKVGGNGCPGDPTAVPGPARWPCPLPGIALFLSA